MNDWTSSVRAGWFMLCLLVVRTRVRGARAGVSMFCVEVRRAGIADHAHRVVARCAARDWHGARAIRPDDDPVVPHTAHMISYPYLTAGMPAGPAGEHGTASRHDAIHATLFGKKSIEARQPRRLDKRIKQQDNLYRGGQTT
ncbi:protein of unknown function [Burkholderia multivorans]